MNIKELLKKLNIGEDEDESKDDTFSNLLESKGDDESSKENKARKNAIDGLKSGTSIEIKEIKILPKKKKKDDDDDLADVPTMVTGSH